MIPFLIATALAVPFAQGAQAPLSEMEIAQKLAAIPVFIPVGEKNAPLIANQNGKQTLGVFFGREECEGFVAQATKRQQSLGKIAIFPTVLAALVGNKAVTMAYVPLESEKAKALEILRKEKPTTKDVPGVPLFFIISPDGNYLTITRNNQPVIPLLFSWQEAEDLRKRAVADIKPAPNFTIKVTTLEQTLTAMRSRPASDTRSLAFVPQRKALEDYDKLMKNLGPQRAGGGGGG